MYTQQQMLEKIDAYDNLIRNTSKFAQSLSIYPQIMIGEKHIDIHKFLNKLLYNALAQIDLIIAIKYTDVSYAVSNQLEANYFARVIAHNSYEILSHPNKLVGKELREVIKDKIGDDGIKKIDQTGKNLNLIHRQHGEVLKEIRHNLFGHKNENGIKQTELISKMNNQEIFNIGEKVFKLQNTLLMQFMDILEKL